MPSHIVLCLTFMCFILPNDLILFHSPLWSCGTWNVHLELELIGILRVWLWTIQLTSLDTNSRCVRTVMVKFLVYVPKSWSVCGFKQIFEFSTKSRYLCTVLGQFYQSLYKNLPQIIPKNTEKIPFLFLSIHQSINKFNKIIFFTTRVL